MALCQVPFTSLATNASISWVPAGVYCPAALQLPAVAHDSDWIIVLVPRAEVPGICSALCQVPFTSSTTNDCCWTR
jgi:hypothetical protein